MHELTLESLAFGGDAVGRLDGKVTFVPFGAPGDRVRVRLVKQTAGYCRGELLELLSPGASRQPPACCHFGSCGGCQWQQVVYSEQTAAKQEILIQTMAEAGVETIDALLAAPRELGYRRRVRMQLRLVSGGDLQLGYYRWRSRSLLDVESCPLLEAPLDRGLTAARRAIAALRAPTTVTGTLAMLLGRAGAIHASVRIDAGTPSPSELERLLQRLLASEGELFAGAVVASGAQVLSGGASSVDLGGEAGALEGSALAFAQANAEQDLALRALVRSLSGAAGSRALELHAGIGNLTQVLARDARELCAVESLGGAAELLRRNTRERGDCAVEVRTQDAVDACAALAARGERFDLALLDPPREGCPRLPPLLDRLGVARVVYVSCDPMTLARDLSIFARSGFRPRRARAIDMMPQSYHLEAVALLER
jgi:23S rRNA (uracil1939-C5)-methyltransferase